MSLLKKQDNSFEDKGLSHTLVSQVGKASRQESCQGGFVFQGLGGAYQWVTATDSVRTVSAEEHVRPVCELFVMRIFEHFLSALFSFSSCT